MGPLWPLASLFILLKSWETHPTPAGGHKGPHPSQPPLPPLRIIEEALLSLYEARCYIMQWLANLNRTNYRTEEETMTAHNDVFGARAKLQGAAGNVIYYRLDALAKRGVTGLERLPYTVKIVLENLLRNIGGGLVHEDEVDSLARWVPGRAAQSETEYPFMPARVLLQDFTGVPAVADLAAMRSAVARMGGNPQKINPLVPADLVIDHSVQVDPFGSTLAFARNVEREYERNSERYALLRWGQQAFSNFRVVPPGTGIVHQVNLEYLAPVVMTKQENGEVIAFPDTLVGTDSHTTMINGLGVLG